MTKQGMTPSCITCRYYVAVVKHPCNKQEVFRGRITEEVTKGCSVEPSVVVIIEDNTVGCEMHYPNHSIFKEVMSHTGGKNE